MKTYGLLTHWDLDGVLSEYFIRKMYDIEFSSAQGYGKVFKNAQKLHSKGVTDLLITDLSPTAETLQWCLQNFNSVHVLDHHQESENYLPLVDIASNFKLDYSPKMCGAAVVFQHIKKEVELSKRELVLLQLCDIYDLWREDRPKELWDAAHGLNDLFWHYSNLEFWGMLPKLETLDMNNLSDEDTQHIAVNQQLRRDTIDAAVSDMTENGSIITLLPDRSAINYVAELVDYDQFEGDANGIYFNIYKTDNKTSQYNCSIRSRGDIEVNIGSALSRVADKGLIGPAGGHEKAGGMIFTTEDINVIIEYIQETLEGEILNGE